MGGIICAKVIDRVRDVKWMMLVGNDDHFILSWTIPVANIDVIGMSHLSTALITN